MIHNALLYQLKAVEEVFPEVAMVAFSTPEDAQKAMELCRMIQDSWRTRRTKAITRRSNYGWKRVMERETGVYVTNGAFIVAAIALGFKYTVEHNPGFSMSLIGKELARHIEIPH